MCCAQIEVSCWTLLVPVSFMPTQLFSRASCWRCCSHNNWWGALLHRRVIKLGFAALAANAASQAGSHNAQDTGCPTEHHHVDENNAKGLASTGPDLTCSCSLEVFSIESIPSVPLLQYISILFPGCLQSRVALLHAASATCYLHVTKVSVHFEHQV